MFSRILIIFLVILGTSSLTHADEPKNYKGRIRYLRNTELSIKNLVITNHRGRTFTLCKIKCKKSDLKINPKNWTPKIGDLISISYISDWQKNKKLNEITLKNSVIPTTTPTPTPVSTLILPRIATQTPTPTPTATNNPIILPIEIFSGTSAPVSRSINFNLELGDATNINDTYTLEFRVYGIEQENLASVSINGYNRIINNKEVFTKSARKRAFGGIGGAYSTIELVVPISRNTLIDGVNKLTFEFKGNHGFSLGFRVLSFNITRNGDNLLLNDAFKNDDPNLWSAPYTKDSEIEDGKALWNSATLITSPLKSAVTMRAHCSDCHAHDGYDLKYFNFSNESIIQRSRFHGLSQEEGLKIASYIRSLPYPNPGRPWNPPYQPGPGIDSRPVNQWAAGAGVDSVLEDDRDAIPQIFPGEIIPKEWDPTKTLNQREIQTSIELPTWNEWLPHLHPKDFFGSLFDSSDHAACVEEYSKDPEILKGGLAALKRFERIDGWNTCIGYAAIRDFAEGKPMLPMLYAKTEWNATENLASYGLAQWRSVKTWEIMRRAELEGFGYQIPIIPETSYPNNISVAPSFTNERSWGRGRTVFNTSPHMMRVTPENHPIKNGSRVVWNYKSLSWYYLAMILNDNHRTGDGATHYTYLIPFTNTRAGDHTHPGAMILTLLKQLEAHHNFIPISTRYQSWEPLGVVFHMLETKQSSVGFLWSTIPAGQYRAFAAYYLKAHLKRTKDFPISDWIKYRPDYFDPLKTATVGGNIYAGQWHTTLWLTLNDLKKSGIDPELINEAADYGAALWPNLSSKFQELKL
jgi:hypothetical protein